MKKTRHLDRYFTLGFFVLVLSALALLAFVPGQHNANALRGEALKALEADPYVTRVTESGDLLFTEETPEYFISVTYPHTNVAQIDHDAAMFAKVQIERFRDLINKSQKDEQSTLWIEYDASFSNDVISFIYTINESYGDTEADIYFKTFNYNKAAEYVTLDSFYSDPSYLPVLHERVIEGLTEELAGYMTEAEIREVITPNSATFDQFSMHNLGLILDFEPSRFGDGRVDGPVRVIVPHALLAEYR